MRGLGTNTVNIWIIRTFGIALILVTVLVSLPSTAHAVSTSNSVLPSEKPSQPSNYSFENLSWPTQTVTNTQETFPCRVFVISNCKIAAQLPSTFIIKSESSAEGATPENGAIGACVMILPSRQIVIDNKDKITTVWSNTTGKDYNFYSLSVWQEKLNGKEHEITPKVLSQYNKLLKKLDWNTPGKVYQSK